MKGAKLYTDAEDFYLGLIRELEGAQGTISMMYYTYDSGVWSDRISRVLRMKQAEGVNVRLMADEVGLMTDTVINALPNRTMLKNLAKDGITVDVFRPRRNIPQYMNRLHCKLCAIDESTVFIGSSNIGDQYLKWRETNIRIKGDFGGELHRLYDYILQYSSTSKTEPKHECPKLDFGDTQFILTIPGHDESIRDAVLEVIQDAKEWIYIQSWYFLPDAEILESLISQVESGVEVNVLIPQHTRSMVINAANIPPVNKIVKAGAKVFRFDRRYMHAKAAWNDRGRIIIGSANLEVKSLKYDFECCLSLKCSELADELTGTFIADSSKSKEQTASNISELPYLRRKLADAATKAVPLLYRFHKGPADKRDRTDSQ